VKKKYKSMALYLKFYIFLDRKTHDPAGWLKKTFKISPLLIPSQT
jgi:hypothetical protein